jgi:hypothetical protein
MFNYTAYDGVNNITYAGEDPAATKFGVVSAAAYTDTPTAVNGEKLDINKWVTDDKGSPASAIDPGDLSAEGKIAWDGEYLYIALAVADDVHAQTQTGGRINDMWQGDSIQIAVGSGAGVTEIGFALTDGGEINKYCWSGGAGNIEDGGNAAAAIVRDEDKKLTSYEIAVKWSYLGVEDPKADDIYKFTVCVNDNDVSPTAQINRKAIEYGEGIAVGTKGLNMGYILLTREEEKITLISAVPKAEVEKLAGNKNNLTITITEVYSNDSVNIIAKTFSIDNNAENTYEIGGYTVYVNTKGNTQIRGIYIVK